MTARKLVYDCTIVGFADFFKSPLGNPDARDKLLPLPNIAFAVAEPAGHCHFLLGEELHAFLALHVQVAEEGFAPAVERKPGHGCRHAYVDAHHPGFDAMLEFARRLARTREYRSAVSVGRTVGQLDGGIQISEAHDIEDGTENLLARHGHPALHVVQNGGADEEAIRQYIPRPLKFRFP